jgi:hypothetical protein
MLLDQQELIDKSILIFNKSYKQSLRYFVDTLRLTRIPLLKTSGFWMGPIQSNMLKDLSKMQGDLRNLIKKRSATTDPDEIKGIDKAILGSKQWIRTLQTIADGIAWRAFKFNRPLLRVMSENSDSGDLSKEGFNYVAMLRRFLAMKPFIIANDLTRVLRIGDLTMFFKDGRIIIQELKDRGGKLIDVGMILDEVKKHKVFPNRQKARQLVAQMAIIKNKIEVPVIQSGKMSHMVTVDIVDIDFKIKNYFLRLRHLIKLANRNSVASELVDDGYYIEVIAGENINTKTAEIVKAQIEASPDWIKKKDGTVLKISNFDSFIDAGTEFPRNMLPYSVFPISIRDCVRLMMGFLHLYVFIDLNVLRTKLEERGWSVTDTDLYKDFQSAEDIDVEKVPKPAPRSLHMFDENKDDKIFYISKTEEGMRYTSQILLTDALVMASSLYGFNFILDAAEIVYEQSKAKKESRTMTRNYVDDRRILV